MRHDSAMRTSIPVTIAAVAATVAALASELAIGAPAWLLVGVASTRGVTLVMAVLAVLVLWVSLVWAVLRGVYRLFGLRMNSSQTLLAAAAGLIGVIVGWASRRAVFGRP